jgi:hypothetical protein
MSIQNQEYQAYIPVPGLVVGSHITFAIESEGITAVISAVAVIDYEVINVPILDKVQKNGF